MAKQTYKVSANKDLSVIAELVCIVQKRKDLHIQVFFIFLRVLSSAIVTILYKILYQTTIQEGVYCFYMDTEHQIIDDLLIFHNIYTSSGYTSQMNMIDYLLFCIYNGIFL